MPPFPRAEGSLKLSDHEQRLVNAVLSSMPKRPEVDWDNVAKILKLKDGKCARERYRQVASRHGWAGSTTKEANTSATRPVAASAESLSSYSSPFETSNRGTRGSPALARGSRSGSSMSRSARNSPDTPSGALMAHLGVPQGVPVSKNTKAKKEIKAKTATMEVKRESAVAKTNPTVYHVRSDSDSDVKVVEVKKSKPDSDVEEIQKGASGSDEGLLEVDKEEHEAAKRSIALEEESESEPEDDPTRSGTSNAIPSYMDFSTITRKS